MTRPLVQFNDIVRPMNDVEYQQWLDSASEREQKQANFLREERTRRLAECDWTQLPDVSVDSAAWATYRQRLRDVPSQAGFPWEIDWPVEPA